MTVMTYFRDMASSATSTTEFGIDLKPEVSVLGGCRGQRLRARGKYFKSYGVCHLEFSFFAESPFLLLAIQFHSCFDYFAFVSSS